MVFIGSTNCKFKLPLSWYFVKITTNVFCASCSCSVGSFTRWKQRPRRQSGGPVQRTMGAPYATTKFDFKDAQSRVQDAWLLTCRILLPRIRRGNRVRSWWMTCFVKVQREGSRIGRQKLQGTHNCNHDEDVGVTCVERKFEVWVWYKWY